MLFSVARFGIFIVICTFAIQSSTCSHSSELSVRLSVSPKETTVNIGDEELLYITVEGNLTSCIWIEWESNPEQITTVPPSTEVCPGNETWTESIVSCTLGIVSLQINAENYSFVDTSDAFTLVSVPRKPSIDTISIYIGWIYTVAWDISFLPQIYRNWKRHSVVGLSFDFLTFNAIGFFCYSLFNVGLYFISALQDQYNERHPATVLHVRINDVVFPIYAVICTLIQIIQCRFYERGDQKVSKHCMYISAGMALSILISIIMKFCMDDFWWLDVLYWLSYIKLIVTIIKYTPQLYLNYKNQSTDGWSIWQVILDCTGGTFSLLQMFLLAYNYDDWHSLLTDPTKLGLGLLSILFNIFFFIQHFALYKSSTDNEKLTDRSSISNSSQFKDLCSKKLSEYPQFIMTT